MASPLVKRKAEGVRRALAGCILQLYYGGRVEWWGVELAYAGGKGREGGDGVRVVDGGCNWGLELCKGLGRDGAWGWRRGYTHNRGGGPQLAHKGTQIQGQGGVEHRSHHMGGRDTGILLRQLPWVEQRRGPTAVGGGRLPSGYPAPMADHKLGAEVGSRSGCSCRCEQGCTLTRGEGSSSGNGGAGAGPGGGR